ncbi:hypothetical protein SAMN05444156_2370 [Verrucomicrobium sp. GAS474]|uniref:hypothetical protein n=1 Tax=Verrucomicrobium sp. GAS474 TaxID=1882831 RepID=UPI00087A54B6|nr:hypothetical protein [Verrucomicrobium sp. GAS474]SDU16775.1 hypothetical protein SAMN05444156_2370 [Verrucomicrobium sp. GAS474]
MRFALILFAKSDSYLNRLSDRELAGQRRLFSRVKGLGPLFLALSLLGVLLGLAPFLWPGFDAVPSRYSPFGSALAFAIELSCSAILAVFFLISLFTKTWKRICHHQIGEITRVLEKRGRKKEF